jgi:hypothetical protein
MPGTVTMAAVGAAGAGAPALADAAALVDEAALVGEAALVDEPALVDEAALVGEVGRVDAAGPAGAGDDAPLEAGAAVCAATHHATGASPANSRQATATDFKRMTVLCKSML